MLQLFSALQEHGLNLLIANGFLDSTKGQPALGNGLWNELAMCWLVWPGLNAAINSCRSGSQWEYGPWRNSVAVCGHFFWPIFLFEKYGWLSRVLFLNWIKDSSRKMSTSTVWCKILLLDVFQICIFSFFSKILDKHVDGWVQRRFIRMASCKFLAFVDCMLTKKRTWIRTSWRCLIFFNNICSIYRSIYNASTK